MEKKWHEIPENSCFYEIWNFLELYFFRTLINTILQLKILHFVVSSAIKLTS